MFTDDVTQDRSSRVNSEVFRDEHEQRNDHGDEEGEQEYRTKPSLETRQQEHRH